MAAARSTTPPARRDGPRGPLSLRAHLRLLIVALLVVIAAVLAVATAALLDQAQELERAGEAAGAAEETADQLRRYAVGIAVGGGVVALTGLLIAVAAARSLQHRAERVRAEALSVAVHQLPDLVARLQNGERVDTSELPAPTGRRDELGAIGDAVARLARHATDSAIIVHKERDGFKRFASGASERALVVVTALLRDLDALQRRPGLDEELKEVCYDLDHELVQLRRQLENPLLLTGGSVPNPHTRQVPAGNIIVDAVGESPGRRRVRQEFGADGWIVPEAAGALTHLLAELIDNALAFSAPQLEVVVRSVRTSGGIAFEVEDRGNGLSARKLSEMNGRLRTAPLFAEMADTHQLGLFVVGLLSAQFGVSVTLRESAYGGLSAVVMVPRRLLAGAPEGAAQPTPPDASVVPTVPPSAAPAPARTQVPTPRAAEPTPTAASRMPVAAASPAPAPAGAKAAPVTADGLPRRRPGTHLARQLNSEPATPGERSSALGRDDRSPEELAAQFDGFPIQTDPERSP